MKKSIFLKSRSVMTKLAHMFVTIHLKICYEFVPGKAQSSGSRSNVW